MPSLRIFLLAESFFFDCLLVSFLEVVYATIFGPLGLCPPRALTAQFWCRTAECWPEFVGDCSNAFCQLTKCLTNILFLLQYSCIQALQRNSIYKLCICSWARLFIFPISNTDADGKTADFDYCRPSSDFEIGLYVAFLCKNSSCWIFNF